MRIVLSDFISLDGVVQSPGGQGEDPDGGFAHGGWSMPYFEPETMGLAVSEGMADTEALLFGRRTLADDGRRLAGPRGRPLRGPDERDPQIRGVPHADPRATRLAGLDPAARRGCDRCDPGPARAGWLSKRQSDTGDG